MFISKTIKTSSALLFLLPFCALGTGQGVDPASDPKQQPYSGTDVSGYKLTWSDEFSGDKVDEKRWHYRLDCKHWSQQKAENNVVVGGVYRILLRKETLPCPTNHWLQPGQKEGDEPAREVQYTGGGIISNDFLQYGYYETRMKVPSGAGWHSSFWMMVDLTKDKDPSDLEFNPLDNPELKSHLELDPFENDSIDLHHYQTDAHQWKPKPGTEDPGRTQNKVGTKQIYFKDGTSLDQFHVIGFEFTEMKVRYFFDGKLVSEADFAADKYKHNAVNVWFTAIASYLRKTKAVDDSKLPDEVQVDYVRFFEK
ncbi:glycoside hydrolase family 16 protein [Paraglaciecola sp.]|uniref:glycoside hydrolase family 16 protein n=1 Tax=Paraglaciecola sp. TaxID=1920173 RepID=UPI003EF70765